jgi:hypothetical protein
MSDDFQNITVVANPEQAQVRDGSRRHAKKFPFRLSAAPTPEWVAIFNKEWSTRSAPNRAAGVHGDILILECVIDELPLLAESLEDDLTAANRQYRERLQRQGSRDRQEGQEERELERTDDDAAISEALGKLKRR